MPTGPTPVVIDGETYQADFRVDDVTVVTKVGSDRNDLPVLLRTWFGPDAGLPGTAFSVAFERQGDVWNLTPARRPSPSSNGPELWRQYAREQIPPLFGLSFNASVWSQGFIFKDGRIFLLVTLDKSRAAARHQYQDRFLSPDLFQWQSQNRQHRAGTTEQKMARHVELAIPVHLFVRKAPKIDGRAAPFLYCGTCEFVDWEGDRPITVRWRLASPLPQRWWEVLRAPE